MLELVNLRQHAGRRIGDLSGGEQQRVAARAGARLRAPLLLMDERWVRSTASCASSCRSRSSESSRSLA
jgi:ABC-type Fe3+/spermidine/putrescine transport system ATPase subunit